MIKLTGKPEDVSQWVELPLEAAPPWWCLPGDGGRIIVRGYDPYWYEQRPLAGSRRWALDIARVPVASATATSLPGPGGPVYPGDCVIYFGTIEGHPEPWAWYPQRVIRVFREQGGRATVWSLIDMDPQRQEDEDQDEFQSSIASLARHAGPLHSDIRRTVLNTLDLAIECPFCGGHGRPLVFGLTANSLGPHAGLSGCVIPAASRGYECPSCQAVWATSSKGRVSRII